MAVSWVGGTSLVQTTGTSINATTPSGLADGDQMVAGVYARSIVTPPSGWTLLTETSDFSDGTSTQRLRVYKKDAVVSGDASQSLSWSQSSSAPIGVVYAAVRGADSSPVYANDQFSEFFSFADPYIDLPSGTIGTASGELLVAFGSIVEPDSNGGAGLCSSPGIVFSGSVAGRLVGCYRTITAPADNITSIFFDDGAVDEVNIGAGVVSILFDEGSPANEGYIEADGPLDSVADPEIVVEVHNAASITADGPLDSVASPEILGWNDNSAAINLDGVALYFMDLVTPDGDFRAPISSWQATLQTESAQYAQCVIPNAGAWVDTITAATSFKISRQLTTLDGATIEYLILEAPLDDIQYAQGSTNYSATISGYAAAPAVTWPTSLRRNLRGVRTVFTYSSGMRIRCAIDWMLQPAQVAVYGAIELDVAYINIICNEADSYMDVGERVA